MPTLRQLEKLVTDRGSRYAVSGCLVNSRADIDRAIAHLVRQKKYAKATHNSWGAILSSSEQIKNDDGESGAGKIILEILQREEINDHLIIVSRWYGGVHLGADRFRHVRTCVKEYLRGV